jgi:ketosteroid isomerase-like protein
VSARNSERVKGIYDSWNRGDFAAGAALLDKASAFVLSPEFPDSGVYVGPQAVASYMKQFLEPWDRLTVKAVSLAEFGDSVVAEVEQRGEGRMSGAVTGFTYFQVWTFRGPTLVRLENLMTRAEAMKAVGA